MEIHIIKFLAQMYKFFDFERAEMRTNPNMMEYAQRCAAIKDQIGELSRYMSTHPELREKKVHIGRFIGELGFSIKEGK